MSTLLFIVLLVILAPVLILGGLTLIGLWVEESVAERIGKWDLPTYVGGGILAAATNANVMQTGGYFTSHAVLVIALSAGVFAGARVIGTAPGKIALVIVAALFAGELYNFSATAERIVVERESQAAPLKDLAVKRQAAIARLNSVETGEVASAGLTLAKQARTKAQADYTKELREGGRCKTICTGLKADADKADAEVTAAVVEADAMKAKAIEAAKKEVAANPLPASATPLADRLGWAPWVLDLMMAALLSLGANGLAGTLVAFGAPTTHPSDEQSDYTSVGSPKEVARFFHPDQRGPDGPRPDSPRKPGPSGGLSKSQALDDLMQRLADGQSIPSQDTLASDWNRPKQTVSDWMREWRRIGVVPAATPAGRCKATMPA